MIMAERVVQAYEARAQAANWAEWAKENPSANRLLNRGMGIEVDDGE